MAKKAESKPAAKSAGKSASKAKAAKPAVKAKPTAVAPKAKAKATPKAVVEAVEKTPAAPPVEKAEKIEKKAKKARAAEAALAVANAEELKKWQDLKEKHGGDKASTYSMSGVFPPQTAINHKALGWGFIVNNINDRLEVLFESGRKILISNYKP